MRRRRFWVSLAAIAAIAAGSVAAAVLVYVRDHQDFHQMQRDEAVRAARQAEAVTALSVGKLATAAAFAQTFAKLNRHRFEVVNRSLLGDGALAGAAYIPKVTGAERRRYEASTGVEIREHYAGLLFRRERSRAVYFPVTFGSAYHGNEEVLGLDVGADPVRGPYLRRARDAGRAIATPVVPLLVGGSGINVFEPVYRDGAPIGRRDQRRRALTGFIAASIRVRALAATAADALPPADRTQLRVDGKVASGPSGKLADAATVPLRIADRTWYLTVKDPGSPDLGLPLALAILGISLSALLASLVVGWNRGARMRELERQAAQDSLTGLGNRRRFEDDLAAAIARCRRDGTTGALLVLDLDRFKAVNDAHGHPVGDELIREVAEVLRRRTRAGDSLARLGGDEFAVILPRGGRKEARTAAEAIAGEIRAHHPRGGSDPVTVSVGIAIFGGDADASVATVVADADAAMYAAKGEGRDRVLIFEPARVSEDGAGR